jgi:hypothetical protein
MGLAKIDGQELDLFVVLVIEFMETDRPLDIRGSGEAPKDQGDWLIASKIGEF